MFEYISLGIAAICFILFFTSFVTLKTPPMLVLLSAFNIFLSSYLSAAAWGVVQYATLSDGTPNYVTINNAYFNPMFFSWLFQIIFWYSIIMFLIGIAFTMIGYSEYKREKRTPKWKKEWNAQNNIF